MKPDGRQNIDDAPASEAAWAERELEPERYELREVDRYRFELTRREFVRLFGAGLLVTVTAGGTGAQEENAPRFAPRPIASRVHIGADGRATVLTGKVEIGQGARTEIAMAAAEELRLPPDRIIVQMADTDVTPNDGGTFGSMTTPRTIPQVRRGCAAAREVLLRLAAERLGTDRSGLVAEGGRIRPAAGGGEIGYGELASAGLGEAFAALVPDGVEVRAVEEWDVLGRSTPKQNAHAIVTGAHAYPSDIRREGMLYGAVLRPPSYGATLESVDLEAAKAIEGVVAVRDGEFAGCAGPTSRAAAEGVRAMAATAKWKTAPHPSSAELFDVLRAKAKLQGGGWPRPSVQESGQVEAAARSAHRLLEATYLIPPIQHAPLEPRAAVAEWQGDRLKIWTGSQVPTGVQMQAARAFRMAPDRVRVIIPDTGGGFGGKHTGETAVEAARLAKAAGRPVSLRWSREEEFTWAYFRPAGVIDIKAGLTAEGSIASWEFININSGSAALGTPYAIANVRTTFMASESPLREGSYRALAATANVFARESMMDELAAAAGIDPLAFRLKHIRNERLRGVLEAAVEAFGWEGRRKAQGSGRAVGLACATEKGSHVAGCAEIEHDADTGEFRVTEILTAFECGAMLNPGNVQAQVEGCVIMGLGGALMEEVRFENGKLQNGSFGSYPVPRLSDVPKLRTVLVDRRDLDPVGAGETPILAVAPAIGNAVFAASGVRLRRLPLRTTKVQET